jgi:hypothetical protein
MKPATLDLIRAVLKSDETLQSDDRERIILYVMAPGQPVEPRIISVAETCKRLGGLNRQTIYRYCRAGILQAARLPGRERARGITESSIVFAIQSRQRTAEN